MSDKNGRKIAIGALIAAAAGYVAGILSAPRSGKQTRELVKDKTLEVKADLESDVKKAQQELSKKIEVAQVMLESESKEIKKEIEIVLQNAKKVEKKAKQTIKAVKDGKAKDPDLNKALDEVNSSLEHFKKFIKN